MKGDISVFTIILLLGMIQGFLLSLALLGLKKENKAANRFLALFLLLISLTMLGRLLVESALLVSFPNFLALPDAIIFLYGPLMYLYLRKLMVETPIKRVRLMAYFIPAALFLLSEIPLLFHEQHPLRILWEEKTTLRFVVIEGAAILHNVYFFILQCSLFLAYKKVSKQQHFSYWVMYSFIGITLLFWMASYFSWVLGFSNLLSAVGYRIIWMLLPLVTYAMGYFAMRNPHYFVISVQKGSNYKKRIPQKERQQILKAIIDAMDQQQVYRDPDFSLSFLTDRLFIERNKLSQVINDEFKTNFNDWTNSYRINDSKALLRHSNKSIKEIYYEVGFNSKSAFNSAFKKKVGMTPSEFRQEEKVLA